MALTVTDLNLYIKSQLEGDLALKNIQVTGEISNFKNHSSGHFYFTLKDTQGRVNAIMFASYAKKVKVRLEDGMKVVVDASIGVYPQGGTYQLYVSNIQPIGLGTLYLQYEQLKKQLASEGLFAEEHKKPIPAFPTSIGVISAKEGAAIRDVITTIKRRWPLTKITLLPSLVQGSGATHDVSVSLQIADTLNFDTIIVARGGGSIEDLWCFNEEEVARTVYSLKTPVISAIGHETDFTIIDFVSDKRAATPTAAAEIATPNIIDIISLIDQQTSRLKSAFYNNLEMESKHLQTLASNRLLNKPELLYANKQMQLDYYQEKLNGLKNKIVTKTENLLVTRKQQLTQSFQNLLTKDKHLLANNIAKLSSMNPLNVLTRGYGMIQKDGKVISSVKEVNVGQDIEVLLNDGKIQATVSNKEEKKHG